MKSIIATFVEKMTGKWNHLSVLYLFAVVCSIFIFACSAESEFYDTQTYIDAWDVIKCGVIDVFRTPVYPCLLGIAKTLFGEDAFLWTVSLVQWMLFLPTVLCFYRISQRLFASDRLAFVLSMVYVVIAVAWVNRILTESLAMDGIVVLLWCIIKLYDRFSMATAASMTAVLMLMIFLRPAFVYLLPMLTVWWILVAVVGKKYRTATVGVAGTAAVAALLLLYMAGYERQYGTFSMSNVSKINQIANARVFFRNEPERIKDEVLRAELYSDYSSNIAVVSAHLTDYYRLHPDVRVRNVLSNLYKSTEYLLLENYLGFPLRTISELLTCRMSDLYMFLLIYTALLIYVMIKQRRIPLLTVLMYMWTISHLFVAIAGAHAEYGRLFVPALLLVLLLFGGVCTIFRQVRPVGEMRLF